MLALDRAVRGGLDVRWLFSMIGEDRRVRFHGVPSSLLEAQAAALGRTLLVRPSTPADFERNFVTALEDLRMRGADGIIFGNIHLADVRAWYEDRTTAAGFRHVEPLWGDPPADLVGELLARGYRTRIVSVDVERGRREWLGRVLDDPLRAEIATQPGADPAGERGEYHSFAFDGPLFAAPVEHATGRIHEAEGHALLEIGVPPGAARAPV